MAMRAEWHFSTFSIRYCSAARIAPVSLDLDIPGRSLRRLASLADVIIKLRLRRPLRLRHRHPLHLLHRC
jgi:hypothetical protein